MSDLESGHKARTVGAANIKRAVGKSASSSAANHRPDNSKSVKPIAPEQEINNNDSGNGANNSDNNNTIVLDEPRKFYQMDSPTDDSGKAPQVYRSLFDQSPRGDEAPTKTPPYTSLFAAKSSTNPDIVPRSSFVQPASQPKVVPGIRNPIRKQKAEDHGSQSGSPLIHERGDRFPREASNFNRASGSDNNSDNEDDDEINEQLPFSASLSKLRNKNRRDLSSGKRLYDDQPRLGSKFNANHKHYAHNKISYDNESRPPSFTTCQSAYHPHNCEAQMFEKAPHLSSKMSSDFQSFDKKHHYSERKFGSQDSPCSSCSCTGNSFRKTKLLKNEDNLEDRYQEYSKTKRMHLILKSIILILLTLLLSMLFIGVILASHYLPQNIAKMLNTSHTFTVTIA